MLQTLSLVVKRYSLHMMPILVSSKHPNDDENIFKIV